MRTFLMSLAAVVAACGPVSVPSLSNARITPDLLYAGDLATCEGQGWHSADGFEDESRIAWSVNGQPVATGEVLDYEIRGGDTVTCSVTPFDGEYNGSPVTTTVIVQNTEPSVDEARISPMGPPPPPGTPLMCWAVGFHDVDGDVDLTRVAWSVDGIATGVSGNVGASAVWFMGPVESGHTYRCTVTPFDGLAEGESVWSEITIQ